MESVATFPPVVSKSLIVATAVAVSEDPVGSANVTVGVVL